MGGGITMISFTIYGVECQAEEGMTWEQWVNSEYNIDFMLYSNDPNYITLVTSSQLVYDDFNNRYVTISDIIRANYEYTLSNLNIEPV